MQHLSLQVHALDLPVSHYQHSVQRPAKLVLWVPSPFGVAASMSFYPRFAKAICELQS